MGAFIHKTSRGQGAGGVRLWHYDTTEDWLCDGLRLAEGMGRKNALAGLWWGGGKGVICCPPGDLHTDAKFRATLFREYGSFLTSLRGCYVSAEDLGVTTEDIKQMFSRTRFTTCIPPEIGGSGNPSIATAKGVVCAMQGAMSHLGRTLKGAKVAVMGLGHVARPMIRNLFDEGVDHVIATDVNPTALQTATEELQGLSVDLRLVARGDCSVLSADCDIVSPCAVGGVLNSDTIPNIRAPIVCGAANNQLLHSADDDEALLKRDIIYVPDFLANRMGIVNCANESYGYLRQDPLISRHFRSDWNHSIFSATRAVLKRSREEGVGSGEAANRIADELIKQEHPIMGHRSAKIIQDLVDQKWEDAV
eukprot:912477_1